VPQHITLYGFDALGGSDVGAEVYLPGPRLVHAPYNTVIYNDKAYSGVNFSGAIKGGGTTYGGFITLQAMIYGQVLNTNNTYTKYTDEFTRTDNSTNLGSNDQSILWTQFAGTGSFGIITDQAYLSTADGTNVNHNEGPATVFDHSWHDGAITATFNATVDGVTSDRAGLIFRWTDANNFYNAFLIYSGGIASLEVDKVHSGTVSIEAITPLGADAQTGPYTVTVQMINNAITAIVNNKYTASFIDSFNNTATKHGFSILKADVTSKVDNYVATPAMGPELVCFFAGGNTFSLSSTEDMSTIDSGFMVGVVQRKLPARPPFYPFDTWPELLLNMMKRGSGSVARFIGSRTASDSITTSDNATQTVYSRKIPANPPFFPFQVMFGDPGLLLLSMGRVLPAPIHAKVPTTGYDLLNTTDSSTAARVFAKTSSDTLTTSDSAVKSFIETRTTSDTLNGVDAATDFTTIYYAAKPTPIPPELVLPQRGIWLYKLMPKSPIPKLTYDATVLFDAPQAYWKLNETNGSSTVADATGNGWTGTTVGSPTLGDVSSPGTIGGTTCAFANDPASGTSSKFTIAPSGVLLATLQSHDFTLEGWVWLSSSWASTQNQIFAAGDGFTTDQALQFQYESGPTFNVDFWADGFNTAKTITTNTWHHVAWTFTTATKVSHFYVDGSDIGTTHTHTGQPNMNANNWAIGGSSTYWRSWYGKLSRIALYNYVLSSSQVSNHYTVGTT